ncbi:MAG: 4Fe-4S binding protein [Capsulimonadaceae bacterium]|nr:4Fe-4S binding protein [Capsulimonadaceae bacterium]
MIRTLIQLAKGGLATPAELFPDLPEYSRGLPMVTDARCSGCGDCAEACPTSAIRIGAAGEVALDRGRCIACDACTGTCSTGTLAADRRTRVAALRREDLVLTNAPKRIADTPPPAPGPLRRSLHIREVSTGDNATDLEIGASTNPIFDGGRFGIHVVASPRHADALAVSGPVARAMREPLLRCYDAMADPRIVIAVGAAAISGVPWEGGYADANGVEAVLPANAFIPGSPPHPWYILHGLLLAMGHPAARG